MAQPPAGTLPGSILVVEDDVIIALALTEMLEALGHTICGVAASGAEALEIADGERPVLALIDIGLAGAMDGIDTARALHDRFAVACVFTTGSSDPEQLARARAAQPLDVLAKPYDQDQLRRLLEALPTDRLFPRP